MAEHDAGDLGEFLRASGLHRPLDMPEPARPTILPEAEAMRLRDSLAAFQERHEFKVGMIVRQKALAPIYKSHGFNGLSIVVEILAEPVFDDDVISNLPYFRMPLDMIVGSIEPSGGMDNFCCFHVDSRRFEPVPDEELAIG